MAIACAEIKAFVLSRIRDGKLKAGDRLPSRPEIEKRFGCARATVDRAFAELKRDGVLVSEFGRGTFVAAPPRARAACASAAPPAIVLPHVTRELQRDLYAFNIHRGLVRELTDRGLHAHTTVEEPRAEKGPGFRALSGARVVYWVRPSPPSVKVMEALAAAKVPQLLLNRDYGAYPCVVTDAAEGQRDAVRRLAEHGHARIGYLHLTPNAFVAFSFERLTGFLEGVHAAGIAADAAPRLELSTVDGAEPRIAAWLQGPEAPTALVVSAGHVGVLMRAVAAARLRVPQDLSVVTIDEVHDPSGLLGHTFACQRQRLDEIGRRGARMDPADFGRDGRQVKLRLAPEFVTGTTIARRTARRASRTRAS